jgi:hypothetical protein
MGVDVLACRRRAVHATASRCRSGRSRDSRCRCRLREFGPGANALSQRCVYVTAYQPIEDRCTGVSFDDGLLLVGSRAFRGPLDAVIAEQAPRLVSAHISVVITASLRPHPAGSWGRVNSPAARGAQRLAVICSGDKRARRGRSATAAGDCPRSTSPNGLPARGAREKIGSAA